MSADVWVIAVLGAAGLGLGLIADLARKHGVAPTVLVAILFLAISIGLLGRTDVSRAGVGMSLVFSFAFSLPLIISSARKRPD